MTARRSDLDLAHLRDLLAKATPGPWRILDPAHHANAVAGPGLSWPADASFAATNQANTALIVALVNAAPALLAAAGALQEVREMLDETQEDRDTAIRLMSELLLKTPATGNDRDGFIIGYVLPTGPLHRIAAYLTEHGQSFPQTRHYSEMNAERDEARATVERVRALADHWERTDTLASVTLRAALDQTTTKETP